MLKKIFYGALISIGLLFGSAFFAFQYSNRSIQVYNGLSQEEANQMVSLLLLNQMHAVKLEEGTGTFKVSVPEGEFVSAVERLRQSGLPQRKFLTIDALFPTNQLVSSPAQEAAKLAYLKEQRLESLLSSLEGVIEVHVIISEPTTSKNGAREQQTPCTASVLIKHAADANLENFITQIKSLAKTSVAGLEYENISVVLQWTEYRGEGKEG